MRMINFLAQRRAQALNRETAWACLTSNLGLPGFGSLLAGRISALPQLLLSGAGMLLTMTHGVRFISWFLQNQARLQDPDADPIATWSELWPAVRWALAGIGLFALAWI
jgi:hypothetical protein